jgi:hypothetical protein
MKIIFASIAAALVIGLVAAFALNTGQRPAYEVYSTSSTRVGDPGHNLVGDNWSGNPARPRNG